MSNSHWHIEFYKDVYGREPCREWMNSLAVEHRAALIEAIDQILAVRGLGVCASEWGKQLGEGLFEFRVRHTANEINKMFGDGSLPGSTKRRAILLRVFCYAYGKRIVLLLSGYDKGKNSDKRRQVREITKARKLLAEFKSSS